MGDTSVHLGNVTILPTAFRWLVSFNMQCSQTARSDAFCAETVTEVEP